MAIVHDVMPVFELFQPTTIDDTVALLEQYEKDAWVLAGGMDTFDWLKDRNKRRNVVVDLSGVQGLSGVKASADGGIEIGATTTLTDVVKHPLVKEKYPRAAGTTVPGGAAIGPAGTSATQTRQAPSIASTRFSTRTAAWR